MRGHPLRTAVAVSLCLAACLTGSSALADRIQLRDGRVFEGRVVSESASEVKFETTVANIKSVLTFRRQNVVSLERTEGSPAAAPKPKTSPSPAPTTRPPASGPSRADDDAAPRCLTVPLKGVFGEDILADGVRDALVVAARSGVHEVEFRIDSPGGYVAEAEKIVDVMKEFDSKLRYHAVIDRALSASMWIVSMCDTVFMTPQASTGAAVAFRIDVKTGAAQVDAKMLSAIAAKLAANAEARGKPGDVFRAMVVPEAELFRVTNAAGVTRVTGVRPPDAPGVTVEQIDDRRTVLTLTPAEAVSLGLAQMIPADGNVGLLVEGVEWRSAGGAGEAAMRRAAQRHADAQRKAERNEEDKAKLVEKMKTVIDILEHLHSDALALDPRAVQTYYYDTGSGLLTPQSQADWRRNTDNAIDGWMRVIDGVRELESLQRRYERLGDERLVDQAWLRTIGAEADREIATLRENRNRYTP